MNFTEIANARQSCRSYDPCRVVEKEKLDAIVNAARLSPSACNSQPYHFTVCRGDEAKEVALLTRGVGGMNKFAVDAPVLIVISEQPYSKTAALGAKMKHNDYRSLDIGIAAAYLTAEAAAQGLGSCILGWFDDEKIRKICGLSHPVRLVITLGYPGEKDQPRKKKRKPEEELISWL
ncbi:MAG: nitroreductase family protein [Oscillospiraceae bacterium]|nr:nitroreductase family protein [Oscillospiraceae bacterium]